MKKIVLASAALVIAMTTGSVLAAGNSLHKGSMGLSIPVTGSDFVVEGKYLIENNMAVLGGFGLDIQGGDNQKGTDIGLMGGARKYYPMGEFAPFLGGRVEYRSTQDSTVSNFRIGAEAGAEYFVGKQFSVEGRAGFGYSSTSIDVTPTTTLDASNIGTTSFAFSANFYF
mgnify:FL=1